MTPGIFNEGIFNDAIFNADVEVPAEIQVGGLERGGIAVFKIRVQGRARLRAAAPRFSARAVLRVVGRARLIGIPARVRATGRVRLVGRGAFRSHSAELRGSGVSAAPGQWVIVVDEEDLVITTGGSP